jgi:hypothetical protein
MSVAAIIPPPRLRSSGPEIANQMDVALDPKPDAEAVGRHLDPLDQQLDDSVLLGREQLVPQRLEGVEGIANRRLGNTSVRGPRCPPGGDNDLGLNEKAADLSHYRRLNVTSRDTTDRARIGAVLQGGLADIVAVELAAEVTLEEAAEALIATGSAHPPPLLRPWSRRHRPIYRIPRLSSRKPITRRSL